MDRHLCKESFQKQASSQGILVKEHRLPECSQLIIILHLLVHVKKPVKF